MEKKAKKIALLQKRSALLREINEIPIDPTADATTFLSSCCLILCRDPEYSLAWVGQGTNKTKLTMITAAAQNPCSRQEIQQALAQLSAETTMGISAIRALADGQPIIMRNLASDKNLDPLRRHSQADIRSCGSWPLVHDQHGYGVLTIYSTNAAGFDLVELDLMACCVAAISRGLYLLHTSRHLQVEHEFNCEIIQTVQALLVSLSHCGEILSFNPTAQEVTGFREEEVKGKFWVDILISPDKRAASQRRFSRWLKDGRVATNFQAELQTRYGARRIIEWHGSFRADIEQGQVGLVLFGIDITRKKDVDRTLEQVLDKWENIFTSLKDPALIVSDQGCILDVNPATATAAQKLRHEIIGKGVCEILHGGRSPGAVCPLETLLAEKKSRVFETELQGLRGNFLLTVSPLRQDTGKSGAALLLARDLTEEQLMKAEAFRAAQLASVGELAAGVAHEINNPINGIINYAQILIDTAREETDIASLRCIIQEGKRIAGITRNLLEFSRKGEETPEPVSIPTLFAHCIELIRHQYTLDGITISQQVTDPLPLTYCNPQQIQQVLLNIFSNARHALNERYPSAHADKRIDINVRQKQRDNQNFVHITITDYGTGIEQHLMDRLMDPFYSTKTKGEGTGLGLSISHSLVQENKGYFSITSEWSKYTTLSIDLPVAGGEEE